MVLAKIKMKKLTHIKSIFLILCTFGSLQLFPMETASHKKFDGRCWWKEAWFFAKNMVNLPKDIADIILYNRYLLRINTVYKKFDLFFLLISEA